MSGPFPTKEQRDARRVRQPLDNTPDPERERVGRMQEISKAFKNVYATPDGLIALEYIMTGLCHLDVPFHASGLQTPNSLTARAEQFDIGYEVHRLIHADLGTKTVKPNVNTTRPTAS